MEVEGLPGRWVVLYVRAAIPNPVRRAHLLPSVEVGAAAFELYDTLGSGDSRFTRLTHAAHTLAHLRISGSVAGFAARLATGLPGSALTGRESHPLDDKQDFRNYRSSFPS